MVQLLNKLYLIPRTMTILPGCPSGHGYYDALRFWYHERQSLFVHVNIDGCATVGSRGRFFWEAGHPIPRVTIYSYLLQLLSRPGK
jgi:hypothetical protein